MDPGMEELPTDFLRGLDFNIKKTSKGGYADYSTSNWARKESSLTEVEQAAIEAHGLHNLADFLPKKPNEAELRIIKEMFEASVDGQAYDAERWGNYYKPRGVTIVSAESATPVAQTAVDIESLEKQLDDIINGVSPIYNLVVNGSLVVDSKLDSPLTLDVQSCDPTSLVGFNNLDARGVNGYGGPFDWFGSYFDSTKTISYSGINQTGLQSVN